MWFLQRFIFYAFMLGLLLILYTINKDAFLISLGTFGERYMTDVYTYSVEEDPGDVSEYSQSKEKEKKMNENGDSISVGCNEYDSSMRMVSVSYATATASLHGLAELPFHGDGDVPMKAAEIGDKLVGHNDGASRDAIGNDVGRQRKETARFDEEDDETQSVVAGEVWDDSNENVTDAFVDEVESAENGEEDKTDGADEEDETGVYEVSEFEGEVKRDADVVVGDSENVDNLLTDRHQSGRNTYNTIDDDTRKYHRLSLRDQDKIRDGGIDQRSGDNDDMIDETTDQRSVDKDVSKKETHRNEEDIEHASCSDCATASTTNNYDIADNDHDDKADEKDDKQAFDLFLDVDVDLEDHLTMAALGAAIANMFVGYSDDTKSRRG